MDVKHQNNNTRGKASNGIAPIGGDKVPEERVLVKMPDPRKNPCYEPFNITTIVAGEYDIYTKWGPCKVSINERGDFEIKTKAFSKGTFVTEYKNGKPIPDGILRIKFAIRTSRVFVKSKSPPWMWEPSIDVKHTRLKVSNGYVTIGSNNSGAWLECSEFNNEDTIPIDLLRRNGYWYVRYQTSNKKKEEVPLYCPVAPVIGVRNGKRQGRGR